MNNVSSLVGTMLGVWSSMNQSEQQSSISTQFRHHQRHSYDSRPQLLRYNTSSGYSVVPWFLKTKKEQQKH